MIEFVIEKINEYLEKEFLQDQDRLTHIRNVLQVALDLGEIFGVDKEKILIAALLHDATKRLNFKENLELASKIFDKETIENVPKPCLHAYSAAALASMSFEITDKDILNAITYHCSGREKMSDLEKIIFVADYIEDSRDFVSDELRTLAKVDLAKAVYVIMKQTIEYLVKNNRAVSKLTEKALKYYESEVGELND